MTAPLTPPAIVVFGPTAADSNAAIGVARPINLQGLECRRFLSCRWTQLVHTSCSAASANKQPSAHTHQSWSDIGRERSSATIPIVQVARGFVQSGFCEVTLTAAHPARAYHATSQNPQDSRIVDGMIQDGQDTGAFNRVP
jgi:hypothetical protein